MQPMIGDSNQFEQMPQQQMPQMQQMQQMPQHMLQEQKQQPKHQHQDPAQYQYMQYLEQEQGQQAQQHSHQAQHEMYDDMDDFVKDVSANMEEEEYTRPLLKEDKEQKQDKKGGYLSYLNVIPNDFRDPLLVFALVCILSNPTVVNTLTNYIPQLKKQASGTIPLAGIAIYGIIYAILFYIIKRLL